MPCRMTSNNTVKQIGVGRHGIKTMPAFGMSASVDFLLIDQCRVLPRRK